MSFGFVMSKGRELWLNYEGQLLIHSLPGQLVHQLQCCKAVNEVDKYIHTFMHIHFSLVIVSLAAGTVFSLFLSLSLSNFLFCVGRVPTVLLLAL